MDSEEEASARSERSWLVRFVGKLDRSQTYLALIVDRLIVDQRGEIIRLRVAVRESLPIDQQLDFAFIEERLVRSKERGKTHLGSLANLHHEVVCSIARNRSGETDAVGQYGCATWRIPIFQLEFPVHEGSSAHPDRPATVVPYFERPIAQGALTNQQAERFLRQNVIVRADDYVADLNRVEQRPGARQGSKSQLRHICSSRRREKDIGGPPAEGGHVDKLHWRAKVRRRPKIKLKRMRRCERSRRISLIVKAQDVVLARDRPETCDHARRPAGSAQFDKVRP